MRSLEWADHGLVLVLGLLLALALLAPLLPALDRGQLALGALLLGALRLALRG